MPEKFLFLFKSTRSVVKSEKLIRNRGIKCLILPVPKNISSECGMCIEVDPENSTAVKNLLISQNITFNKITTPI